MPLGFERILDAKDIYDQIPETFSEIDFNWTLEDIQSEMDLGHELWAARNEEGAIVAALFYRMERKALLTKHSSLNLRHQGRGYSHEIKKHFEEPA